MQKDKALGALAAALLGAAGLAAATPAGATAWVLGDWYQFSGNGMYYSVQAITGDTNGWLIAEQQAAALTGPDGASASLASITSADLDAFIFAGVDDPAYWSLDVAGNNEGPNIGGHQTDKLSEPAGHWAWVDGSTWAYTQWNPGEPNNQSNTEDYATLFASGSGRSGNWNDIGSDTNPVGTQGSIHYYIAESSGVVAGVPEPAAWALMLTGFLGAGALLRRRRAMAPA